MLRSLITLNVSPVVTSQKRNVLNAKVINMHKDVIDKNRKEKFEQQLKEERKWMETDEDMPKKDLKNPFLKPGERCILCKHNIQLDYKNVRLLSQFTSPYTGRIYGRGITGLCLYMQRRVATMIQRSRYFGYMPYEMKEPKYVQDPKLFDPFKKA